MIVLYSILNFVVSLFCLIFLHLLPKFVSISTFSHFCINVSLLLMPLAPKSIHRSCSLGWDSSHSGRIIVHIALVPIKVLESVRLSLWSLTITLIFLLIPIYSHHVDLLIIVIHVMLVFHIMILILVIHIRVGIIQRTLDIRSLLRNSCQ